MDDYPMPLYDADLEAEVGVPEEADRLHDVLVAADVVIFACPEFNGGPTPLLKNAIDWVTRVSKRPLEGKPVGLISATPGSGGGAVGLGVMSIIMRSLRARLHDQTLPVGNARARLLGNDDELNGLITVYLRSLGIDERSRAPSPAYH